MWLTRTSILESATDHDNAADRCRQVPMAGSVAPFGSESVVCFWNDRRGDCRCCLVAGTAADLSTDRLYLRLHSLRSRTDQVISAVASTSHGHGQCGTRLARPCSARRQNLADG